MAKITEADRAEARQYIEDALAERRERMRQEAARQAAINQDWDNALGRALDDQHAMIEIVPTRAPRFEARQAAYSSKIERNAWHFMYGVCAGALAVLILATTMLLVMGVL